MANMTVHIRFPEDKIKEPIIYQIGTEYNVVTNVGERTFVKRPDGWTRTDRGDARKSSGRSQGLRKKGMHRRSDRIECRGITGVTYCHQHSALEEILIGSRSRLTNRHMELTEQQIERYSRQIILSDVGGKGQMKLSKAKVCSSAPVDWARLPVSISLPPASAPSVWSMGTSSTCRTSSGRSCIHGDGRHAESGIWTASTLIGDQPRDHRQ